MAERACEEFAREGEGKAQVRDPVEVYIVLIHYRFIPARCSLARMIGVCAVVVLHSKNSAYQIESAR